jgi:hypothetical protein
MVTRYLVEIECLGRGIWNYDFGLLPYRKQLLTVIGKPIKVPLIVSPTAEDVDKYHKLYVDGLKQLHADYQHKLGEKEEIRFVE